MVLWVCKRASQSTVVFSVSGIVELYPSITSRKTGGLEALLFLANTASRRILWWTWIRCFFPLHIKLGLMNFLKALHKNRAAFQHLSTVFPGLSAAKFKEGIFVGPQIQEILNDTDFEELRNWEHGKDSSQSVVASLVTHAYQITKPVLRSC